MIMSDLMELILISSPIYAILIWTYFNPKESMLLGGRWKYKEEPEISERAIKLTKIYSVISIIIITISLIIFYNFYYK